MNKSLALLFISLLIPICAFSQYSLQGRVFNYQGQGIQDAQISLFQDGELAALTHTGENGQYEISKVAKGKYLIVASGVGLSSREDSIMIDQDKTQNFALKVESVVLDSVVVERKSSVATSKGHIFYLSKKAQESGNPFVALQEIPLLYCDPINETVKMADGQGSIILIDGMRVNSGVSPIHPSRIKSVEIIDVVGAKYMRQGVKHIIHIKLKDTSLYTYAKLSARADYPQKNYFVMPEFEIGNSTFSLYGDASPSTGHSKQKTNYQLTTPSLVKEYAGKSRGRTDDYDYSLMAKWRMTKKDYLAAYIQREMSKDNTRQSTQGEQDALDLARDSRSLYRSHLFSATTYYKHLFSDDEEMEAYAAYTDNRADNTNSLEELISGQGGTNAQQYKNVRKAGELTLSYTKDFDNGGTLELGNETKYSYDKIDNVGIENFSFRHHRLNEYVYAGYSGKLGRKLTYLTSVGMEYMSMKSDTVAHHYFRPRLSMTLYYRLLDNLTTQIGYSFSNTAPSVAMLSPYNTSADTLLISHGNPYLMPAKNHSLNWNANYFNGGMNISTGVSYGISSDIPQSVHLAKDNGVLLTTYENEGRFRSLEFNGTFLWRKNGFFMLAMMKHHVNYYTTVGARRYFTGSFHIQKTWGKFQARATFTYETNVTEYSKTKQFTPTSTLVFSYNFTPDILLSLGCNSFIGNPRSKTVIDTGAYRSVLYTTNQNFTPWVLFRWSIRKNTKKKIGLDNDILREHEKKFRM